MQNAKESLSATNNSINISRDQQRFVSWMTAVLLYTVVLNLFVEYSDAIVIDSFTISVLCAIMLKASLDAILLLEHSVALYFGAREGTIYRLLRVVATWAILFLSKFVILAAIDIIFGEHVEIRGFIPLVVLIITMLIAELILRRIYERLGQVAYGQ